MTEKEKIELIKSKIESFLPVLIDGNLGIAFRLEDITINFYWVKDVLRIDIEGLQRKEVKWKL